jgi:lipopolysaccharide export system permease protein
MTLGVFTFVILLGNVLKEVMPLLVSGQASLATVGEFIGLLIPYVWLYALPMSVLAAILLVFGRFSADLELTAARASGISLLSLSLPVLLLSLVLCAVCALINLEAGPMCRKAYKDLRFKFLADISGAIFPERQFIREGNLIIWVGKNRQGQLEDVMIAENDSEGRTTKIRAVSGRLELDFKSTNRVARLHLSGVRGVLLNGNTEQVIDLGGNPVIEIDMKKAERAARRPALSDLTFTELRAEYRAMQERVQLPPASVDVTNAPAKPRPVRLEEALSPIRVELHRKLALSFSCFGFALIGIPLGIRVQRRESNVGFALALVLVVIYYTFILAGTALEDKPQFLPHLWMWIPNILFQIVGAVLLWRANRGA